MPESLSAYDKRQMSTASDFARRWADSIVLAAAVALAYFLAARFSVRLILKPEGVAVFWPAAGISSGILIALGPRARWPVLAGVIVATVATHLIIKDPLWAAVALGLCNGAEALVTAGLIQHYFGGGFNLVRLRHVLSLLAAAVAATIVSGIGGAATYRLMQGPSAPMLNTWQHWFASDFVGIIAVAPLVIGLTAVARRPSPRSEVIEGILAVVALAAMTGFIILLPRDLWNTAFPITWLFPILLWLAARDRPAFSAAGAFVVSATIVWTTILGIGHFGDTSLPIIDRVLGAQVGILVVALSAYVLAALFAERRESATHLAHANTMLERERDNKLMNLEAMAASISHELKQPQAAIAANAAAALRWLKRAPPDLEEARSSLGDIASSAHRTSQILDNLRALFGKVDQKKEPVDVNEVALSSMRILHGELNDHGVKADVQLASELPLIMGQRIQLLEVFVNLVRNAIEAMDAVEADRRALVVRTKPDGSNAIIVEVKDSGPGIDSEQLRKIFGAFVTTKPHGMGLGLAICRAIVERHGGQLSAMSDVKNGTLFKFFLPMEPVGKGAARAK
jgi:signal transduction histidine kinase